jgi:hypothetical protein
MKNRPDEDKQDINSRSTGYNGIATPERTVI